MAASVVLRAKRLLVTLLLRLAVSYNVVINISRDSPDPKTGSEVTPPPFFTYRKATPLQRYLWTLLRVIANDEKNVIRGASRLA